MEKFGIFELLDALSALASAGKEPQDSARPDANTSAFAPPAYPAGYDANLNARGAAGDNAGTDAPLPPVRQQGDALSDLLSRHDKLSKKIDENR